MKEAQKRVKEFAGKNSLNSRPEFRCLDLASEIGELCKEVLKSTDYGRGKEFKKREETELELGDACYSLLALANELNIDLETALEKALLKYEKRIGKGKNPDSKND